VSTTVVANISLNCRPTLFAGRPISASLIEVSHTHLPNMHLLGIDWRWPTTIFKVWTAG